MSDDRDGYDMHVMSELGLEHETMRQLCLELFGTDDDVLIGLKSIGVNAERFTEEDLTLIEDLLYGYGLRRNGATGEWEERSGGH